MQGTSAATVQIGEINFTQGGLKPNQQLFVTLQRSTHTVGDHKDGRCSQEFTSTGAGNAYYFPLKRL